MWPSVGTIVAIRGNLPPMMDKHYHIWVRSGVIFMFKAKRYKSRAHANKVAAEMRADPEDRMVRACVKCPESRRSKRQPPRWPRVATAMAETLGADAGEVRRALVAALKHEKKQRRDPFGGVRPNGGEAFGSDNPTWSEQATSERAVAAQGDRMETET